MSMKKEAGFARMALIVVGLLGCLIQTSSGQQKGVPGVPNSTSQGGSNLALQQAQLMSQAASPQPASRSGQGSGPFSGNQVEEPALRLLNQAGAKGNDERQKRLENDARRLLALANLLKSEVATSGSESMTPEMLRQMDEIEKLARSVKDRMRM